MKKEYDSLINEITYQSEQIKKEFYILEKNKILRFLNESTLIINLDGLKEEEFYFLILLSKYFENIDEYNLLTIDVLSSNNRLSLNHLSSGEQIFIKFFIELFYTLEVSKINKEDVILMLDEIELTLHPNLQKKLMYYLIKGLKRLKFIHKLHIIINTHSPFILSDLSKENIIFLQKGKQVYPFEDGKQTFGANIHTLLSHGFFMKDGLMGEFAKDKIQSIIKYHEDIEKKEVLEADKVEYKIKKQKEFWQIQSIIGDDYLKQVIKNHLVEIEKIVLGNDEAKEEEIKRLEAQIEQLRI
ncbi:AAA family ATPase [Aliarcobacter butzleri]|uniref:AAA family ATPase n=1 Tax=Aliarcobacter butzleri TaxID=28197 RepID=UPI00263BF053|nr:AAA family ATPase [Aliarcobacter butzleri]MDN5044035.1 AAA family ATPase [Aliarcobacter butzleri]